MNLQESIAEMKLYVRKFDIKYISDPSAAPKREQELYHIYKRHLALHEKVKDREKSLLPIFDNLDKAARKLT